MKIAVLMSTYNGEKYLKEQIDSILYQDCNEQIDLIVRDDGSYDKTIEILNEYKNLFIKNRGFKWYSDGQHLHSAKSFIKLLYDNEGYDYYLFADQDDYWLPMKISKLLELFNNDDKVSYKLIFTNAEVVDENLNYIGRNVKKTIPPLNFKSVICNIEPQGCTMIFNKTFRDYIVKHNFPYHIVQHDEFLSRLIVIIGGKLKYYNISLIKYRQHDNNLTGVTNDILRTIQIYVKTIFNKKSVPLEVEIKEMYDNYTDDINDEKKEFLNRIINYNLNFLIKLKLVFDLDIKSISFFANIKDRLTFLFGNK